MSVVQVIIDRSATETYQGVKIFDRDNGGTFVGEAGVVFPGTPVAGEWFWRTDTSVLYRRNDANDSWESVGVSGYLTTEQHKALRQLIHFIDNGPAEGFATGAYRETTGTVFPSAVVWYDEAGGGKKKIVEKLITYTGAFPTTIMWKVYDATETLLATVTDTITYSGAFETSRSRAIS